MVALEAIPGLGGFVNGQEREGPVVVSVVKRVQVGTHVLALVTKGHTPIPRLEGRSEGYKLGFLPPKVMNPTQTSMKSVFVYRM